VNQRKVREAKNELRESKNIGGGGGGGGGGGVKKSFLMMWKVI